MKDINKDKDMFKDLNKLITYLNEKDLEKEADDLSEIMRVAQLFERPPFDDNVKVAASYPGNMGVMEMFQFQREATPAQKKVMDRLLNEDRTNEAWEFLKKTTGVDLHDPPDHTPSRSQKVIETIEGVKIYRDTDWAEYIVVPVGGSIQTDGYHTDDLEDAVETAKSMAEKND
jgi:hypothetical protein